MSDDSKAAPLPEEATVNDPYVGLNATTRAYYKWFDEKMAWSPLPADDELREGGIPSLINTLSYLAWSEKRASLSAEQTAYGHALLRAFGASNVAFFH